MTVETLIASLHLVTPELILAVGAMVLLMIGVFSGDRSNSVVTGLAIALLIFSGAWLVFAANEGEAFNGAYLADGYAKFMKILALIGSVTAMIMAVGHARYDHLDKFEFPVLLVLATLGVMLLISANDLIALYLAPRTDVAGALRRRRHQPRQPALDGSRPEVLRARRAFVGMLLYGMSLVYGFTGNTGFDEIAGVLSAGEPSLGLIFGLVFVLAGLAFKISAVPFHMWTPDVYEGAPTPVTAFLAAAPKIGAMAIFVRIVIDAFLPIFAEWQQIVVFIAIASMVLGSVAAIGQKNIKRLMAYSSIGHMGYALVGLAAGNDTGVAGVLLYMMIYLVMTLGTFACIMAMRQKEGGNVENIDDLAGLSTTRPFMAFVLTALMFSLAGIPPLAGFFAKYFVFVAAIEAKLYALAIIGVLASVIGAYYYLRIIKVMWFDEAKGEFARTSVELRLVFGLSGFFVVGYVLFGGPLGTAAEAAAKTLFN